MRLSARIDRLVIEVQPTKPAVSRGDRYLSRRSRRARNTPLYRCVSPHATITASHLIDSLRPSSDPLPSLGAVHRRTPSTHTPLSMCRSGSHSPTRRYRCVPHARPVPHAAIDVFRSGALPDPHPSVDVSVSRRCVRHGLPAPHAESGVSPRRVGGDDSHGHVLTFTSGDDSPGRRAFDRVARGCGSLTRWSDPPSLATWGFVPVTRGRGGRRSPRCADGRAPPGPGRRPGVGRRRSTGPSTAAVATRSG